MTRWWWPGLDVDVVEIRKEIAELDEHGFGGVEVQAFLIGTPAPDATRTNRFAPNPYYYDMIEAALDAAKEHDMVVDLTISSSWPPGGSWVPEEDSLKILMSGTTLVRGPGRVDIPLPPIQLNAFYKYKKLINKVAAPLISTFDITKFSPVVSVAIMPIKKNKRFNFMRPRATPIDHETAIDVTGQVKDGRLQWDAPAGTWQVFTFYAGPAGVNPLSDAKSAPDVPSRIVDMFDPAALQKFLGGHLDPGINGSWAQHAGSTLRALFTDSQEISAEWFYTGDFFGEFQRRRGYDVRPFLPACFVPNRDNQYAYLLFMNEKPCFEFPNGVGERIRHDWEETLSDLFAERYCGGVAALAAERGLKHRIQVYGIRADMLKAYGRADIPEVEQLHAGGNMDFIKLAASAAVLYNKPLASCESFVWMDRDYMNTPFKIKVAADRLFVAGINHVIYHGTPYQAPWKPFPGHYPWSPPSFSENMSRNNPFWPFLEKINGYIARAQQLLRSGPTVKNNVAIYYPHWNYDFKHVKQEELTGGHLPGFDAPPTNNIILWYLRRPRSRLDKVTLSQQRLGDDLMARGYHYIHINDESLLGGEIVDGALQAGTARVEAVILDNVEAVPLAVAERLQAMADNGVHVIFRGSIPERVPGYLDSDRNDEAVARILNNALVKNFHTIDVDQDASLYLWSEAQVVPCIEFSRPNRNIQVICKEIPEGHVYFVRSNAAVPVEDTIGFMEVGTVPLEIDLWTGAIQPVVQFNAPSDPAVAHLERNVSKVSLQLKFEPYELKVLLFSTDRTLELPIHTIKANVEVSWDGTNLKSYIEKEGEYRAMMSNGKELVHKELFPLKPITFAQWQVVVNDRLPSGEMKSFQSAPSIGDLRKAGNVARATGPVQYSANFTVSKEYLLDDVRLVLNLGMVHDVASIKVNDSPAIEVLAPPYELDITKLVHEDQNTLDVTVTYTLRNALVGYGKKHVKGFKYMKRRHTMPAGLIGPARVLAQHVVTWKAYMQEKPADQEEKPRERKFKQI